MDDFRIELNESGIIELLTSREMKNLCKQYASQALAQLGDGYSMSEHTGPKRVNVEISADTPKAKKENLKDNTILKALGL